MKSTGTLGVGRIAFGVSAGVLLLQSAPTVDVRDAGELTTAAFLVDVPHPTGFVADMVSLRLAMLIPVGDVGFRANVATALWMALACALAARLAFALTESLPARLRALVCAVAPAILLASPTIVRAGTATEVYALSLSLAVGSWVVLAEAPDGPAPAARVRVAAFLVGLTALTHTGARPAALVSLGVLAGSALRSRRNGRALVPIALSAVLAALPVAYLIVAANAHRYIDWGDPSTLRRLWGHLSAARIRLAFAPRMFTLWRIPEDARHVVRIVGEDLGVTSAVLGLVGAIVAMKHRTARWVLLVACVDVVYAILVNPMGVADRQTLFVAEAGAAVLAALAVGRVAFRQVGSPPARAAVALVSLGAILGAGVHADATYAARADGWSASEILGGAGALGAVPVRSVVLVESDDLAGVALYAQRVEGERPDVTVLPRQHLADPSTWRRARASALGVSPPSVRGAGDLRVARLRALVSAFRPRVRWESGEVIDEHLARVRLGSSETPVLASLDTTVGATDASAGSWLAPRVGTGRQARSVAAVVLDGAGRRVARDGMARAVPLWELARSLDPDDATAYTNLGVARSAVGDLPGALHLTEHAVQLDPERVTAWNNLARYRSALGDADGAARAAFEAERRQ